MRGIALFALLVTSCAASDVIDQNSTECARLIEVVSASGSRETKRDAISESLTVTFAATRNGTPSTRWVTCFGGAVVEDVESSEFPRAPTARDHYNSLRGVISANCQGAFFEMDDFDNTPALDAPPALSDGIAYSIRNTPIALASCRTDNSERMLLLSRLATIDDTGGRERSWAVEERYQRHR